MSEATNLQDNEILLEELESEDPGFSYPFAEAAHAANVNTFLTDTQKLILADVKNLRDENGDDTYFAAQTTPAGEAVVLQYHLHHDLEHKYSLCHCEVGGPPRSAPW